MNNKSLEIHDMDAHRYALMAQTEANKQASQGLIGDSRRDNFIRNIAEIFELCKEVTLKKNKDYTALSGDPYFNFEQEEIQLLLNKNGIYTVTAMQIGLLSRINEKRKRAINILGTGEIENKDEDIQETLIDLINLTAILLSSIQNTYGWAQTKKGKESLDKSHLESLQEEINWHKEERTRFLDELHQKSLELDKLKISNNAYTHDIAVLKSTPKKKK